MIMEGVNVSLAGAHLKMGQRVPSVTQVTIKPALVVVKV